MRRRLARLLGALGLAASALAGVPLPAAAQPPGPELPASALFFPYLPNGVELEAGNGPWFGTITVQNVEALPLALEIREPGTGEVLTTATLNPHASKTFPAGQLGIADGTAGAVSVVARFPDLDPVIASGQCAAKPFTLTRARDADSTDTFSAAPPLPTPDRARVVGFTLDTDYRVAIDGAEVTIDWSPAGREPAAGEPYEVVVWDCPPPRIGGVEKHATVARSAAGRTSAATGAVTGYPAIPLWDLELAAFGKPRGRALEQVLEATGPWAWAFPIVQTNHGWNSVLHLTNFSSQDHCGVTVTFYSSPSGSADPSVGTFTTLLDAGETVDLDLLAGELRAGGAVRETFAPFPSAVDSWVGQAWVSADCAVAATVDRLKAETAMALTLIAQPRFEGCTCPKYAPLVFEDYNGWNTGINIANLSDSQPNTVTISVYNQAGQLVSAEQRVLQPRGVEVVYRPATADVGTGGPVGELRQVVVQGTAPFAAAADSVKYGGARREGQGQALSYLLQGGAFPGETLSVALVQKGTSLAPSGQFSGDTSGINLFNGNAFDPSLVEVAFFDQTGAPVAPTLGGPVVLDIPPYGGATLYTPLFAEMPAGFQGSFVALVRAGGPVAAVSNNVNDDVAGDGTAAFNAVLSTLLGPAAFELALEPAEGTNPAGTEHTLTATVTQDGVPVEGAAVLFDVDSQGNPTPASGAAITDENGEAEFTYTNDTAGEDTVTACVDVDGSGTCDENDPTQIATKTWIIAEGTLVVTGTSVRRDDNPDGKATVTVENTTEPVPVVLLIIDTTAGGSFSVCSAQDENETSGTTGGGTPNTIEADIYACAFSTGTWIDVAAYHDVDGDGIFDPGKDVQIGTTKQFPAF